jgi:hypothetical protein
MCKINIAAYDKVTPPHRSTLHCWPLLLIAAYKMLRPSKAKYVCGFRLTVYTYEA